MSRRYFIETWGCQMNELDSQRMAGQLLQAGFQAATHPDEADIILLNSCSVREKAEQKVFSRLGEYRRLKERRPWLRLGLCGCVAQQVGERALKRVPELDFVLGPARVGELSAVLASRETGNRTVLTGFPDQRNFDFDTISRDGQYKGMVTIIEGCNKRCTFCIVPQTRGPERCRPIEEIENEVDSLLARGFLEIELLGQTVNHWVDPRGSLDFADLLERLARKPGVERLRFVTSYPRDFTSRMVEQIGLHENICPYLHLPVQSGSNRILRLMGRGYSREDYLTLISNLRTARADLALSTDIIVGFPGETEDDFAQTVDLVGQIRFASIFAFKYSERPGTAAPRLLERFPAVAPEVASRRLAELFAAQENIQTEINQSLIGARFKVLVTGIDTKVSAVTLSGRTPCHRVIHFQPTDAREPPRLGTIVGVRVEQAFAHSLAGREIPPPVHLDGEVAEAQN
ncbi:MAG TPA: tRNA (N6-isopentenyl adenosine(37)-C2)-methylthiotransferase MiaB [Thermoanaerobaculia bacterium]|nr:tRNA (N6-isopentenyl adenosine(37)-C2)-methylthiotransferase MiaB [Thermoanaerobaculia bacterium]